MPVLSRAVDGLSPRMRGNLFQVGMAWWPPRSIPAYAGEPVAFCAAAQHCQVYPRVCGGTGPTTPAGRPAGGLSPRMRGNPLGGIGRGYIAGSIPAYAGEPRCIGRWTDYRQVYPRVCGGTRCSTIYHLTIVGLSPRMRGNPAAVTLLCVAIGSIPAYAGEPPSPIFDPAPVQVYPRVCGGTTGESVGRPERRGLSPRMRGNQRHYQPISARVGSIPAYAGEPTRPNRSWVCRAVYPRVCGGTNAPQPQLGVPGGLSPRMRGNRHVPASLVVIVRSIPAYAGEPSATQALRPAMRVYPRVCGGTPPRPLRKR